MKKKIAAAVVLVLIVGIGGFLYFPRGSNVTQDIAATLAILQTDISAQKSGTDFSPALDGELLANGDVVKSSQNGRAVLSFFDGSTLTVDPGSLVKVLTLNRLASGGIQLVVEQSLGRTWASVAKLKTPDSKFELKTPTSTASVRGTAFETIVQQQADGSVTATFKADDGQLVVTAQAGGQTTVNANQQVSVQQNQAAPATASPIPPAPRLVITATAGVGYALTAPTGTTCGSAGNKAEIPGCLVQGNNVTIREPVPGRYTVMLTAASAVQNGQLVVEAFRGDRSESRQVFTRSFGTGELIRTAVGYGAATPLTLAQFEPAEVVTSVCGAQAAGRAFSSGTVNERYDLLRSFAQVNKNAPVALVLTEADVLAAANSGLPKDQSSQPARVRDIAVKIDGAGMHLTAQIDSVISVTATGDVIAGPVDGKLVLRVRNLSAGPLPAPILQQVQIAVEKGLNDFSSTFPFVVRQVALRPGCLGVVGVTPQ
jgi:hypothetical protein